MHNTLTVLYVYNHLIEQTIYFITFIRTVFSLSITSPSFVFEKFTKLKRYSHHLGGITRRLHVHAKR